MHNYFCLGLYCSLNIFPTKAFELKGKIWEPHFSPESQCVKYLTVQLWLWPKQFSTSDSSTLLPWLGRTGKVDHPEDGGIKSPRRRLYHRLCDGTLCKWDIHRPTRPPACFSQSRSVSTLLTWCACYSGRIWDFLSFPSFLAFKNDYTGCLDAGVSVRADV